MYLLPLVSIVRRSVGSRRKEFWYHMICKETKMIWVSIAVCWIFDVSVEHSGSQTGLPYLLPIATLKRNNCLFKLRVLKLLLLFPLLLDFHINYQSFTLLPHPPAFASKPSHDTRHKNISVDMYLVETLFKGCCCLRCELFAVLPPTSCEVKTIVKCFCRSLLSVKNERAILIAWVCVECFHNLSRIKQASMEKVLIEWEIHFNSLIGLAPEALGVILWRLVEVWWESS